VTRGRVAVVGSGVAGLTAAHLLQRSYDVTLFEGDDRLGGHAHTHEHVSPDAGLLRVDSGFIVHNRVTYPNLLRLFRELRVATVPTGMSMSVRCDGCGLEYAGALGPLGVFAQPRLLARPAFLRMLGEVKRFHRRARRLLDEPTAVSDVTTLRDFLRDGRFTEYFVNHFAVPVVAAVWSSAPDVALEYPARYLFTFLANHGMLSLSGSHQWYTVAGGSRTYVDSVAKHLTEVRTSTPVSRISRRGDRSGVEISTVEGTTELFERAVVATHPDAALRILAHPTGTERAALGAFRYSRSHAVLHHDETVLTRSRRARAAWNYRLPDCLAGRGRVLVSYDMNRLQHLPTSTPYLVTLNAAELIDPDRVVAAMDYEHPIYTPESVGAQKLLPGLNDDRLAFAGAYHGWGFHEDGCRAGVVAAAALGAGW
jgi:predicted NAD/FAD-binding protein